MPMYRWFSKMLERYLSGNIIVEAADVEAARLKAINYFETTYLEENDWLKYCDGEINNKRKKLIKDISGEPEILEAIFIEGSD